MSHTFKIQVNYHGCPACQKIIENRAPYIYRKGAYYLDLTCPRCKRTFEVKSPNKPKFSIL